MSGTTDKKALSVEDRLRALYNLQLIDSKIDQLRIIRGELPLEVQDLEDDIARLDTRIVKLKEELQHVEKELSDRKNSIVDAEALIKKYSEQQNNVRNNREYDSLTKEIEYQKLEIEFSEKKIKEIKFAVTNKQEALAEAEKAAEERKKDLEVKQNELSDIEKETQAEEALLLEKSKEAEAQIEERLLIAYKRIRGGARNGLAVVPIDREASAGSFIKIPPQKQLDVAMRKKIIVDEHSGRILVDAELAEEQAEAMEKLIAKALKK
ncbi:MAG: zinc ribbon domain-containing protein [Luteibaculaceae bacterium]